MKGMAPWDEAPFFDAPNVIVTSVGAASSAQIAPANPRRFGLIFSTPAGLGFMGIQPVVAPSASNRGIFISSTLPYEVFFHYHGAVAQMAWWAFNANPGALNVTAIELSLLKWPADRTPPDAAGWARLAEAVTQVAAKAGPRYPDFLKPK